MIATQTIKAMIMTTTLTGTTIILRPIGKALVDGQIGYRRGPVELNSLCAAVCGTSYICLHEEVAYTWGRFAPRYIGQDLVEILEFSFAGCIFADPSILL